jgi:hypothetical protein
MLDKRAVKIEVVWVLCDVYKPSGFIAILKDNTIEMKREAFLSYLHPLHPFFPFFILFIQIVTCPGFRD